MKQSAKFINLYIGIIILLISCDKIGEESLTTKTFRSFEFRYVSRDTAANGITDLKGPTAIFDTTERLKYLGKFAKYAKVFHNDPDLNTRVVNKEEIQTALKQLKPQPKPKIRQQIDIKNWKYLGYRNGQRAEELNSITQWNQMENAQVKNNALLVKKGEISKTIASQDWRMKLKWSIKPIEKKQNVIISLSGVVKVGLNKNGRFFYSTPKGKITSNKYQPGQSYNLKLEIDLESEKYNFYVNKEKIADFVPVMGNKKIKNISIKSGHQLVLDNIWGVGYTLYERCSRTHPYLINTFIDQDFVAPPIPQDFEQLNYDDTKWKEVPYRRYAHGGERQRNEVLYLRKKIEIGDFATARLNIETIRPFGEIYINGKFVEKTGREPQTIDLTNILKPNKTNLFAVKVYPYEVNEVKHHMSTDKWSSWFAGLMTLELTANSYIKDVFVYTSKIDSSAEMKLEINTISGDSSGFRGKLVTEFYPWYPQESKRLAAKNVESIQLSKDELKLTQTRVTLKNPRLWTTDNPNLYRIRIILKNEEGSSVDDYVLTTGIRKVSQEQGTFHINGEPEVLFGPLIFNQPYPMERISQWMFSPPRSKWVETILECKKMNSNAIRMSVHDKRVAGLNDKRLSQIGDQMGIMFIWQTPCWIREGTVDGFDMSALVKYIEVVRNHPSIVMWQPGNHPSSYPPEWYGQVIDQLSKTDPSRLISPAADLDHIGLEDENIPGDDGDVIPNWQHPQLARGNMEQTAAYGKDWSVIRLLGTGIDQKVADLYDRLRQDYLNSDSHAWFDFESEETIGQPNWKLHRGRPFYKMYSYEKDYNIGNIGRVLEFSEWNESQAWQALSAYEAYRKKRWLDYDGMNWCPLRGGPNTATYMKPVIEYSGEAKLSFYSLQMVYQPVLAGSKNVDLVYGPDDEIPMIVMNIGKKRTVDLRIVVRNLDHEKVTEKKINHITLKSGRNFIEVGKWQPELQAGKYYGFEYIVINSPG